FTVSRPTRESSSLCRSSSGRAGSGPISRSFTHSKGSALADWASRSPTVRTPRRTSATKLPITRRVCRGSRLRSAPLLDDDLVPFRLRRLLVDLLELLPRFEERRVFVPGQPVVVRLPGADDDPVSRRVLRPAELHEGETLLLPSRLHSFRKDVVPFGLPSVLDAN